MNSFYRVKFNRIVTSYSFYNDILTQLHDYFENNKDKQLMLDFSEVKFIDAVVIPNILVVGEILKEYFTYPVDLHIPWKPELLSYLSDIGFLKIVRDNKLFELDERFIGGYETGRLNKSCKTYCFEFGSNMFEIRNTLRDSMEIIKYIHTGSRIVLDKDISDTLELLSELCMNGCSHSRSSCYAVFQAITGEHVDYKKACLSISDYGIGYYNSFLEKSKKDPHKDYFFCKAGEFQKIKDTKSLVGILEAIFFRHDKANYGLFEIAHEILKSNGVMRIHSEDTQLIITKNTFYNYLLNHKFSREKLITEYKNVASGNTDNRYSIVRNMKSKFKGVHIEIEIPLNSR